MINNVTLAGRITKDPEIKSTSSGKKYSQFTIAINRSFTDANGERQADFISCITWGNQAENLCKFQKKGNLIGVTGRLQTRQFEDADGNPRYVTEVVADQIVFLETKSDKGTQTDTLHETSKKSNEYGYVPF